MPDSLAKEYFEEPARTELIDGRVVSMAPAAFNHNMARDNILEIFRRHLRGTGCTAMGDNYDLFLSAKDRFVPDVMVSCDRSKIDTKGVHGAPDLVVEVLSPSTRRYDRKDKMNAYEKAGVREYWLVDVTLRTIEQYVLKDNRLTLADVYSLPSDAEVEAMSPEEREHIRRSFRTSILADLEIPLDLVFEDLIEE